MGNFIKSKWFFLASACIMFVLLIPVLIKNQYMMTVLNMSLIYFIAILGLSVMLGMGGQVTFSTAGMMGFGAFISAIFTTRFFVHPVFALILSVLMTSGVSLILAIALFRLKGTYFSFASIGLAQIMSSIMLNWKPVTGGADGIVNIPPLDLGIFRCLNVYDYFYVIFIIAVICGLLIYRVRTTSLGRSLAAVRDNEIAAQCLGINVYKTKIISFVIAGGLAGLAGSLLAHMNSYISATSFTYEQSAIFLVMIMLGGVSSTIGAFAGAVLINMLPEWLRFLSSYYKFVYGVGVIIIMVFMPMGMAGIIKNAFVQRNRKKRLKAERE